MNKLKVLVITGPTASGKTQLSELIASKYPSEIINVDVGQFYKLLSVGTAKPDLTKVSYKHHLFDILDKPEDLSVIKYRKLVLDCIKDVSVRNKIPIIIGGSLFYIKSLLFPPYEFDKTKSQQEELNLDKLSSRGLWLLLKEIDPDRANQLHPNDSYRVRRALEIWITTGQKPSIYKPKLETEFDALIVYVQLNLDVLKKRIFERTIQMIEKDGWIEESERLIGTEWEPFLINKGLIGYSEIFTWIRSGKNKNQLAMLIEKIQIQTMQYAKRQRVFWKSFERDILKSSSDKSKSIIQTITVESSSENFANQITKTWLNLFD